MSAFTDRTVTSFNISIGTGLALESIFEPSVDRYDPDREIPVIDYNSSKTHMYSILTIARNILQACPDKDKNNLMRSKEYITTLQSEIDIITDLYSNNLPNIKLVFYVNNYDKLYRRFNIGKSTKIMKGYMFYTDTKDALSVKVSDLKAPNNAMLFTHTLLDFVNNKKAKLLESHTGLLKSRYEFNSKYHSVGTNDISNLPFEDIILYMMGDRHFVNIRSLVERRALLSIAKDKNWTVRTTKDKILNDIVKDERLKNIVDTFK